MRGKKQVVLCQYERDTVERFLFFPCCMYTDATYKEVQWRWLEHARIALIVEGHGQKAYWREMYWLPPKETE